MRFRIALLATAALLATVSAAHAQSQTSAPPDEAKGKDITVTAAAPDYKSSAERRSYSLANDLQHSTGSVADALANIPSVQVDPQGNVSLRGDPSVTVLIDGKSSALLSGPNRGDALLALPAGQFDRAEVMTNPSAAFEPDGTGGIINLISHKGAKTEGSSGSVSANVGTAAATTAAPAWPTTAKGSRSRPASIIAAP